MFLFIIGLCFMMISCPVWDDFYIAHGQRLLDSFTRLTGRRLLSKDRQAVSIDDLDKAPFALLSHGTEVDPVFNFGNRFALSLFECAWQDFIRLPSRYSAEAMLQEERDALLAQVSEKGYIDHYQGVRISATGKRFMIKNAVVWNIIDHKGTYHGQAAMFKEYTPL